MAVVYEARVIVPVGALAGTDMDQLMADCAEVGLTVTVDEAIRRRSGVEHLAWAVIVALPLKQFLDGLVKGAAADSYTRLKSFVTGVARRVRPSRSHSASVTPPLVVMREPGTGIDVVFEPDLPLQAYRQLYEVDFTTISRGPLHYDLARHRWRSELDETDPSPAVF